MDAMTLLKEDHRKVKKMLAELESTTERGVKTREELFTKVKQELVVHEAIEEEIFYPALEGASEDQGDRPGGLRGAPRRGHGHGRDRRSRATTTRQWGAKFTVMKENLEHHIEEEEGEMFKQAKQVFDEDELAQLGESMMARKEELMRQQSSAA